jgi:3-oxoadipate CoA-transferase beta subunit
MTGWKIRNRAWENDVRTCIDRFQPLSREQMAARLAADIPEGWYVNLGVGIPTLIADHMPSDREVIFHSENGILGMGPVPAPENADPWLVSAGRQNATLLPGGAFFHQAESFAMIRGGHLDLAVLGAFEVAENGDIANWATSEMILTRRLAARWTSRLGLSDCGL